MVATILEDTSEDKSFTASFEAPGMVLKNQLRAVLSRLKKADPKNLCKSALLPD